ncbi:hypothetical protein [Oligoflexus tunisiensis]|uniref:hypothetical protein n=1 Tax=Oligoflexus tunisiensis TaxID=708132 RepID=UPI00114CEF4B|nr:hypothetical protein [Oligoflexus tunisiensis]
MTSLAEKITYSNRPHFDFTIDNTVRRIREHALALDRCKRYTEIPKLSFLCELMPIEWTVFAYYYSLAPKDHPSEVSAAAHLKIGRTTLVKTLSSLAERGMVFFDTYTRSKLKIVNIAHPDFWCRPSRLAPASSNCTDPRTHFPRQFERRPERVNEAKELSHRPGNHVRLPYLLFQTLIHPTAKYIYGLFCYLDINVHPTLKELASSMGCSTRTTSTHIAELEDCRMIYSQAREPKKFGDHTRYYHHLTDVALWRTAKAGLWYRGGENSLIARLDTNGFADHEALMPGHDLEEFRPLPDTSRLILWDALRPESSQVRRDIGSADQVRQISPQVRQESSQIRQEELRQESSQIRQKSSQIRQKSSQIRQKSFQVIEESCSILCPSMIPEGTDFAKNTNIRNANNKNTVGNYARAERWAPVASSFHPRLINIAQAGAIVWKERDYKYDRALWNSAVEQIAIERGETEAIRFVSFVKSAFRAYGREFPYTPQLMKEFLDTFRSGNSWSVILGPSYQDPEEEKSALEGEVQNLLPDAQTALLIEAEITEHDRSSLDHGEAPNTQSSFEMVGPRLGCSAESSEGTDSLASADMGEPCQPEPEDNTPTTDYQPALNAEADPDPDPSPAMRPSGTQQRVRVQVTHANLLDLPAVMTRPMELANSMDTSKVSEKNSTAQAQEFPFDTASEKKSAPRSLRRIELEKAASILTVGLKSQASFQRGFAKLTDDQLYDNLLHMFGVERVQKLVSD